MRLVIPVCVIAFALCRCASAAELGSEARQCFDWFSTLGYADIKDAAWAEVWTGSYAMGNSALGP